MYLIYSLFSLLYTKSLYFLTIEKNFFIIKYDLLFLISLKPHFLRVKPIELLYLNFLQPTFYFLNLLIFEIDVQIKINQILV